MQTTDPPLDFEEIVFQASQLDPPRWRAALSTAIARLEDQWAQAPSTSIAYAIGHLLFHMPGHDERDFLAAEAWLRRAMAMDPNDMYAAYYLGCLYFEYARPDQAIAILSQIPRTFFSSFDQEWRDIKRREIILSCRMMRREAIDGQEIQDIIRIHQTNPAEEVWPLPEELVSTTVKVFTDAPDSQRTRELAGLVIEELERAGLAEVYADEIHRIRRLIDS